MMKKKENTFVWSEPFSLPPPFLNGQLKFEHCMEWTWLNAVIEKRQRSREMRERDHSSAPSCFPLHIFTPSSFFIVLLNKLWFMLFALFTILFLLDDIYSARHMVILFSDILAIITSYTV